MMNTMKTTLEAEKKFCKPWKLAIAQILCRRLPPIISNQIRRIIYSYKVAQKDDYSFISNSITGSEFTGSTKDFHAYPFCIHGYFDWKNLATVAAVVSKGDKILEIGANIGTETIGFSDMVGSEGKVHAFEPLPSNIEALKVLVGGANHKNIQIYPYALSDQVRVAHFVVPPAHASGIGHIVTESSSNIQSTIKVQSTPLDSIAKEIGGCEMIVIDAEGEEVRILRGAEQYLRKFHPTIIVEAAERCLVRAGFTLRDLYQELKELNYYPYRTTRFGLRDVALNATAIDCNWVCIYDNNKQLKWKISKSLVLSGCLPCLPNIHPLTKI